MKSNIDLSFTRRFNAMIEFENPGVDEREQLGRIISPVTSKKMKGYLSER
jgi:hypothetical protein